MLIPPTLLHMYTSDFMCLNNKQGDRDVPITKDCVHEIKGKVINPRKGLNRYHVLVAICLLVHIGRKVQESASQVNNGSSL